MSLRRNFSSLLCALAMLTSMTNLSAQENISWLDDYTGEMVIGKENYRYEFNTVEGKDCKVEFKEFVTDKKGSVDTRSWVFYLADIDSGALRFDSRGKAIELYLTISNSQKFITSYEEGEFKANTGGIELKMNEVDLARSFIEVLREHIPSCAAEELSWTDAAAAFSWLEEHIGNADDDDVKWEQSFSSGGKPHLARFTSTSTNEKGEEKAYEYLFDLSDMNPAAIKLLVSGKSRSIQVPVRGDKRFVELTEAGTREYTDEVNIRVNDIDLARQTVQALTYLVSNTVPERPSWETYGEAMEFVKGESGPVQIGETLFENSLLFENDPSGIVDLTIKETNGDGKASELIHSFYLTDMKEVPVLEVSRTRITIELETKEGKKYIRNTEGESVSGYDSDLQFHVADINRARDLIHALEYAIAQAVEEIQDFTSVDEVNSWMEDNFVTLYREGESYEQQLSVDEKLENQITFRMKHTKEDEVTETLYLVYPEDIKVDELDIDVSLGKLNVSLETGKYDYIKEIENGRMENFRDKADVYFYDPLTAKNFIAAIGFLKANAEGMEASEMGGKDAFSFLTAGIQHLDLEGKNYEQTLELRDGEPCKLKFTRVETKDDGESKEFVYEFAASDIHSGSSGLSVHGKLIEIKLATAGGKKLIKPYENGEVDDFEDEFAIYADDILLAKKILAAFTALSDSCE